MVWGHVQEISNNYHKFSASISTSLHILCQGWPSESYPFDDVSLSIWWLSSKLCTCLTFLGIGLFLIRQWFVNRFVNLPMVRQTVRQFVNGSSIYHQVRQWGSSIVRQSPIHVRQYWRTFPSLTNRWRTNPCIDEPLTNWRTVDELLTNYSLHSNIEQCKSSCWIYFPMFAWFLQINLQPFYTHPPASKNYSIPLGLGMFWSEIKANHGRAHSFDCLQRPQAWTWNLVLHAQEDVSQGDR